MNGRRIKKLILILCILVMTGVAAFNYDKFYVEKEYIVSDKTDMEEEPREIEITGSHEVRQEFTAKEKELSSVKIEFKAWEQRNDEGKIYVEVQDQDGSVLGSARLSVRRIVQSKYGNKTKFELNAPLEKGKVYDLVVRSEDVKSEKGVFLYAADNKGSLFDELYVDGTPAEGRIRLEFKMITFSWKSMGFMLFVLAAGIVFVAAPLDRIQLSLPGKKEKKLDVNIWMSRILFIGSVPMSFFIVQRYSGYGIMKFIRFSFCGRGLVNYLLYGLVWWLLYLIINRTKYTAVFMTGIFSILGLVNYFVWNFRGTPIMAADIASLGTAMDVAANYTYSLDLSALWALVFTVVFICAALSLKSYRGLSWKKRLCVLAGFFVPYSIFYTQLLHGTLLEDHNVEVSLWRPQRNYAKNGSLLSFFLSYTYYRVEKPEGYSLEKVTEIADQYQSDTAGADNGNVKPNIIAVMNETFSDLSVNGELSTSEDYMPYIHGLSKNTVKGELYVSVFGGNTANSEFEFLTGCSMGFLPFRSVAYDTYIKSVLPSLTYNLKADGYSGNNAVHPGAFTAWNRNEVYPLLGFENFYYLGDFKDARYVRNFMSDEADYDFVIKQYEETRKTSADPFYIFNVTIQNHGGYLASQGLVDTVVKITDDSQKYEEAEQYINLIKISDSAFEDLTKYFEDVDEPTVIVMFGDHQPALSDDFYESLSGKSAARYTLEDTINKYTVPYVIWANYDIGDGEGENMSANYFSAYLMQLIGGNMTGYQKYLMDLYQEVPMITANGYRGADGVMHELGDESQYSESLQEYKILQYNNLFDGENRPEEFYHLAEQ